MCLVLRILTFSVVFVIVSHAVTHREQVLKNYRLFRIVMHSRLRNRIESAGNLQILRERNKLQPFIDPSTPFPCQISNKRSVQPPSSVHKLQPGDIDVIGALGDSLTVGVGLTAKNLREVYFENRGIAPTSGGSKTWREFLTIPNILKEFNPKLVGYAIEPALTIQMESQFNVADTAAMSKDIPNMARILVKRMRTHSNVDFQKHWKLISLMIGPNDFCANICYQKDINEILNGHREDLLAALRTLKTQVPRLFVNLILAPNLKILIEFMNRPVRCLLNQLFVCPCLIGERYKKDQEKFIEIMRMWQDVEIEVANLDEFDTDDFTVVVQPFPRDLVFPVNAGNVTDYTFLSEDCFHFSQKGSAMIANSIWNNMLEPVGRKSTRETMLFSKFYCPTKKAPYLFTRRNSY